LSAVAGFVDTTEGEMVKIGDHAVVLGASMAGLLAARALADFYSTVTVVERDALGDAAANRRGVPRDDTRMGYSCEDPCVGGALSRHPR
jgi:heterodisulfide reductase subunit A-like polyferredoxin